MESLTATAIATLIATKAFETTGDKIGEGIWALVSKFINVLKRKDKATAETIKTVAQTPELVAQQPETYGTNTLVAKVEAIAKDDEKLQQIAQEIKAAVQVQPGAISNMTKLAEKIGVVNQGTIINQTNEISF